MASWEPVDIDPIDRDEIADVCGMMIRLNPIKDLKN